MGKQKGTSGRPKRPLRQNAYPSPAERERIIRRRLELAKELLKTSVMYSTGIGRAVRLIQKYSHRDVTVVTNILDARFTNIEFIVRTLLKWGWEFDQDRIADNAMNTTKWRPRIPDLTRMVLDEGLLTGWVLSATFCSKTMIWPTCTAVIMAGRVYPHP